MKTSDSQRLPAKAASAPSEIAALAPAGTPPAPAPEPEFGFAAPEYHPAQYRWVPVRRRPRSDGWTEEKQRRFIEVLADTGLVGHAAREGGMTRMSAYRLRRAPYAATFARAWDVARERAGALIEDIAFERAIEGVEQEVYDGHGELKGSRTVYNDRLLTFLLSHLKPERYSREARRVRAECHLEGGQAQDAAEPPALEDSSGGNARESAAPRELPAPPAPATIDEALRAMEPGLPAPAEELLDSEQLEHELLCAEIGDGKLAHFHSEQRPPKSPERIRAEEIAAQIERGRLASEKMDRKKQLSDVEFEDMCVYLDPSQAHEKRKKRRPRKQTEV